MKILLSGSTGFIGSAALKHLNNAGHTVIRMVRHPVKAGDTSVFWDPSEGIVDSLPENIDAVIHLGGENISGRWSQKKKERIYNSRVKSTQLLAENIAKMSNRPRVFICASAVGYYGDRGDSALTETDTAGECFLSAVCEDWEAATGPAIEAGIRTVNLRFGMVLAKEGGALSKMLPAFKVGMGGVLGNGSQWVSWVSLVDAARIIKFALLTRSLEGPVNAVAPEAVTNRTFTKILGQTLNRPTILPVPAKMLRLIFGEFAEETLLASTRAVPEKLFNAGFAFKHPELRAYLNNP